MKRIYKIVEIGIAIVLIMPYNVSIPTTKGNKIMNTTTAAVGRPLTQKGKKVKAAVLKAVREQGVQGFTVKELAAKTKYNKVYVNNHVNLLVQRGVLERADVQLTGGRGRPRTIYRVADKQEA